MRLRSQVGRTADATRRELHQSEPDHLASGRSTVQEGHRKTSARQSAHPDSVINAFVSGFDLVLVVPDSSERSGVKLKRVRAEHSSFIKRADLTDEVRRILERDCAVVGLQIEGEWIRVKWASRGHCLTYSESLQEKGIPTYDAGVRPTLRYLVDNDVGVTRPRVAMIDFETDSRVPFSRMTEMRITCWALIDLDGRTAQGVLREDTDEAERELLMELWRRLDSYDLVAAWNGDRFDFPVLRSRTEQRRIADIEWHRWLWLDHLVLFRRMNMMAAESGAEKQSYSLDAIAHAVLGEGKSPVDASKAWDYWAAGGERRKTLVDYNARDVWLMAEIEKQTGYVELLLTLASACGSFPDTWGINPTSQAESFLQRLAHKRGYRFPTIVRTRGHDEAYKGAYVMEPTTKGILTGVHVADFSSLYPSIIRAWNMSLDTKMFYRTRDSVFAHSPLTGVKFDTSKEGLLPAAVSELMQLRRHWNERKASAVPGTDAWKEADRRSTAYKIAANSFYGVIGLPTSRLFDREVAESVSQCGVWLIKATIAEASKRGMNVVYGDTDSLYVAGATRLEFSEWVAWCNSSLYPQMLKQVGCREPDIIKLAYEKEFSRIVFVTMKRYVGRYAHYKGTEATAESKPEIKGLEYKRGDSVRLARQMQEEIIDLLVGVECEDRPDVYQSLLQRWVLRILNDPLELEDVVISKTLAKPLRQYARRKKKDGSWARQLPHVEIARELGERGRDVAEGAKINYVVVDASASPQKVMPAEDWSGEGDEPWYRKSLWEAFVAPPSLRLLRAAFPGCDWTSWEKALVVVQPSLF